MSRSVTALLGLWPALAFGEGSIDTNAGNPANPQWLDARSGEVTQGQPGGNLFTQVFVDVLAVGEVITLQHAGNATVISPTGATVGVFTNNQTINASAVGAYRVEYDRDQSSWDIAVSGTANTQGRVWSRAWHFDAQTFDQSDATFASFYALVEGGDATHDGVVQMKTDGMAGFLYLIAANRFGMTNANGRSVPQNATFPSVPIEYRVYLRPPEDASYDPRTPTISGVGFDYDSGLCEQVAFDVATGTFTFTSDVEGTYHIVCDLGGGTLGGPDGVFDFTDDADLHLIGETGAQSQQIVWDGTDNNGVPVPPGTYNCQAFLTVGEFHYVGGDIETSHPGFRLFEVQPPTTVPIPRSGLPMYWNDELVQANDTYMPSSVTTGLVRSGPDGILSGSYPNVSGIPAASPNVNARSWGNFNANPTAINLNTCGSAPPNECSKGDWAWLDTYTWLRESPPVNFTVTVGSLADGDLDSLLDAEEECLYDTDPTKPDTDGDGLDDDVEVLDLPTDPNNPDSDGDGFSDGDEIGDDPSNPLSFNDGDTLIDAMDPDDDNDGIPTSVENDFAEGPDSDTAPNHLDLDSDGDGIPDATEGAVNSDGDGPPVIPDFLDLDSDDDSVLDADEGTTDTDGDGLSDFRDPDDDGDTIPTIDEVGEGDTDSDTFDDYLDDDDDNDGIPTEVEHSFDDGDSDTIPNHQDLDSDADGLLDAVEGNVNSDDDGKPDFLDTDSDNDSIVDGTEGTVDSDGDTLSDFRDPDDDDDTIPTSDEAGRGDTDGDTLPDHLDDDDDDDGILTATEVADAADYGEGGTDVDRDTDANWYDTNADGDAVLDEDEGGTDDTDRDGVLDYLDPDGEYLFDYTGSCLLSTGGSAPTGLLAGALALAAFAVSRRRRGVAVALAALFAVGTAHAGDGPEISRSTGRQGQVVVLWPRVVPGDATDEIRMVAGALQDRMSALASSGVPDLVQSVRPEPERVCPRGTGCKAPSLGVLLAHRDDGCVVVGWVSEPGKGPAHLVPLAGRLDLKAEDSPFREPPESLVTVRDFATCATVVESLDPAGVAKLQELLRASP